MFSHCTPLRQEYTIWTDPQEGLTPFLRGTFPTPLNEHGISRAWLSTGIDKEAAQKLAPGVAATLKKYGVDTLLSSDLPRGEQSAKLIAREMGGDVEVESTGALRTWNTGDMGGKKESETIPKRMKFIKYPEEKPPGGESFQDFLDRFEPELEEILQRRKDGEELAFIAHGHHLLAAPHILADEEVDPKKLPNLDEDYTPGGVWGFFVEGKEIRIERLDKQENKKP
jgi:broad specificity phosphatase PhoE